MSTHELQERTQLNKAYKVTANLRYKHVLTAYNSVRKFSDSTAVRSHWSRPHNKYSLQYL